jgi:hypothetical protein
MQRLILYGFLGLTGCAAGALLGEAMLPRGADPQGQQPAGAFNPEVTRRLQEAGVPRGEVQVALLAGEPGGVELSCEDSAGEVLDRQHRTVRSGGTFDSPPGDGGESAGGDVVSLHWPVGSAPRGRYQVFVGGANRVAGEHTSFICRVKNGDDVEEFSGTVPGEEPRRLVYEFSFRRAAWLDRLPALRGGLWNALLAVGGTCALLAGRPGVWRRPYPLLRPGLLALLGSAAAGLCAAAGAHLLGEWWGRSDLVRPIGRATTWLVMGGALGGLSALYIPPVRPYRAVLLGASGGALAALAGEWVTLLPDPLARLADSALLGLSLGVAVALAETPRPKAILGPAPTGGPVCGLSLFLPSGRALPLADGVRLLRADLPGLAPRFLRRAVARVVPNPNNPGVFGLMNLSRRPWWASFPDGSRAAVAPGRSVRLVSGVRIDFGPLSGEVRYCTGPV